MHNDEQRLDYLEQALEGVRMHNQVLATALKGLLAALPSELAQEVAESIQLRFEDELSKLQYQDSPHIDLFHDAADAFFREN